MAINNLDELMRNINMRLASYIDVEFYLPLKEELSGVTHSLGFKKELLKGEIERELEELKKTLKELGKWDKVSSVHLRKFSK